MTKRTSDRLPYVGWNMRSWQGPMHVEDFLDSVYELMYSAESAREYVEVVGMLLDECERVGSDAAGVRHHRRAFERASKPLLIAMRAEAVKVSELTPAFVRACVLDGGDGDTSDVRQQLDEHAEQLDDLWLKLVKSAIPAARRAAGDAVYCLAIIAHAKQTKEKSTAPLSKGDAMNLLNAAVAVMEVKFWAIEQVDQLKVMSGRTLLDALAGVIVHMQTQSRTTMVLTAKRRPDVSIRVAVRHGEPTRVEVIGKLTPVEGGPSVAKQRAALRALGCEAPTRKADDRAWHRSFDELSPIEIPMLIANLLEQVVGVPLGETVRVETKGREIRRRGGRDDA